MKLNFGMFLATMLIISGYFGYEINNPTQADDLSSLSRQVDDELIQHIQNNLHARGYNTGEINGSLHAETADAIRSFQAKEGLEVTGDVNQELLETLELDMIYSE